MVNRLVERYGRTGFAAISSVIWFFPMAAWAGSFDLSPMDKTVYPWIALGIGVVMLVLWFAIVARIRTLPMSGRQRRFDIGQMTSGERRWTLGCAGFVLGLIAWLNGAATVDWGPLGSALARGEAGPAVFAAVLALFVVIMVAGIVWTVRGANRAYALRISSSRPAA